MRQYINKSLINKYQTRSQVIGIGIASLLDAIVILGTFGLYRGSFAGYASVDILRNAMEMRRAERSQND